ncbi:uncharacterized protein LOC108153857 [Drosophila miranda]|uniref:uncharacterized protein LOC108153857 n=1 Tax=Drosophila miranda TaxID=7229 RepID=UPI00143F8F5E|nr:uncharacterized protein LOC108153857 [Drosophila miranda]
MTKARADECVITLPLGKIKGVKRESLYDDSYYSYERLPFAKPPIGELRFRAPVPVEPWTGVLDCSHYAEKPVQKNFMTQVIEGNEDCLYLNVYAKPSEKPLPVMVYIYGGAFTVGEATRELYAPDYFMAKDVLLVTFNYRVDCLGFLSLTDPSLKVPGNAGLKDMVLALRWVKKYISHFNGDDENITVFGESAGGCSTHFMMCTEQTRGLYHKAIAMSGTVHNYWANTPRSDFAYRLAKLHGYTGENVDAQVLEHLRGVPAWELVRHSLLTPEDRRNGMLFPFGPTIESYVGEDCVVPKSPVEMAREAWTNDLPAMLGGTSFEGLFMYPAVAANLKGLDTLSQDPLKMVPHDVRVISTEKENLEYSERMLKMTFGDATPSSELFMNMLDYYSYKVFWHGLNRTLQARFAYARAPTYFYRFDFDSPNFNFYRKKFCGDNIQKGVAHADDLSYLFRNSESWKLEKTSGEYRTIQRMIGIWTAFSANSNPNCAEISEVDWQPAKKSEPKRVVNISEDVKIVDLPEYKKLLVWDSIYKPENLKFYEMATQNAVGIDPLEDQGTGQLLMELKNLVLWRNFLRTLFVFTIILILLVDTISHSAISVVSMLAITVILGAMGYRFFVEVLELWNRRNKKEEYYSYRFHVLMTCNIPQEETMRLAGVAVVKLNAFINKMIGLLLVEDLQESLKMLAGLCFINILGDYLNFMNLLLMVHILVFTLPKLYDLKKTDFDKLLIKIGVIKSQKEDENEDHFQDAESPTRESNKQNIEEPKEDTIKEQNPTANFENIPQKEQDLKLFAMFEEGHDPDCSCAECNVLDVTLVANQDIAPKKQKKEKNVDFLDHTYSPDCSCADCDVLNFIMWKPYVLGCNHKKYLQLVCRSLRITPRRSYAETKIVDLPMGRVKGRRQCGIYGDPFFSFEGIPFGKPPLADLRFVAPEPADPWEGQELDAQQERDIPLQMELLGGSTIGSEDCLYLNVYTKHFDKTKPPLPVMVYIYGGAFRTGGATRKKYGPDYLMSKDIVYVIFNYRLCALGFLSLPSIESNVPGNAGLHDQLLALKWIKQHIQHFNGDPENITLFGESAGAVGVHFMMCLPQAKCLFHKAIMMSGSMLNPWAQIPDRASLYCQLALAAGYVGPRREKDLLRYLRWVEAKKLVEYALNAYTFHDRCSGFFYPFVPGVEGAKCERGLVQQPYLEMMRDAWSTEVPLLLGGTSFEGLVFYPFCKLSNGIMLDYLKQEPSMVLPNELFLTMSDEVRKASAKQLVKYHYGPQGITKQNVMQTLDLFSYKLFWHGIHRVVRSRLAHAQAPTYLYRFDFDSSNFNLMRNRLCGDDIKRGVCHADDMGYVFHKKGVQKLPLDSAEYLTIQRMVGILTAFAKTGDPNCAETKSEPWSPLTEKMPYRAMNIGYQLEFITQYEKDGLEVWNRLYDNKAKLYGA